ncbi:hypothetical protein [Acidianus brierleyi]|uniref:Uncharacterized protein n=1 Tax=Acidianus brierleyi TaxID=41673 RepID=A0A2U9IDL7_9CREN|nr:hypothetical protein [Acidianus brierleyi]AWR94122.1 hypothetical protein DFR85_05470 [Acidianus brierleyi]
MPWIPARSADKMILGQALKLKEGKVLRIESFKGDRWIEIKKLNSNEFEINEHGYNNTTYKVKEDEMKVILRRAIDLEFPRSHQLRISLSS